MVQVEFGWPLIRALQHWADDYPEIERQGDNYGLLLTFAEVEVRETFRSLALALAEVVTCWPGLEGPTPDDLDGWLSVFGRCTSVLVLAVESAGADVPPAFRDLVRQVAPLRGGGDWTLQLGNFVRHIGRLSEIEYCANRARGALEALMHDLPDADRQGACGSLLGDIEREYADARQPPPAWLDLVKSYFSGHDRTTGISQTL